MSPAFLTTLDLFLSTHWEARPDFYLHDTATYGYEFALDDERSCQVLAYEDLPYVTCQISTDRLEGEVVPVTTIRELKTLFAG